MEKTKVFQLIEDAIEYVNMEWQVKFYADLMRIIRKDKEITPVTRHSYEFFYGMNYAGVAETWKDQYFIIANKHLRNNTLCVSLERLMDEIGTCEGRIYPSFVSKLLHTLKDDEPIYDSKVRLFLEIGDPKGKGPDERKTSAIEIYEQKIKLFYTDSKYTELRNNMIYMLTKKVPCAADISDTKKMDFVLWALGKKGTKITEFDV